MNRAKLFFAICLLGPCPAHAAVEQIIETFDDGDFANAGWRVDGDATFADGGYAFVNEGGDIFEPTFDALERDVFGSGSFVSRAVFRNLDLGEVEPGSSVDSIGRVMVFHSLGPLGSISMGLSEPRDEDAMWLVSFNVSQSHSSIIVPRTNFLSIELTYNDVSKSVTFEYVDLREDISYSDSLEFGGRFEPSHFMFLSFVGMADGKANGILEHYELFPIPDIAGDFNGNGVLDSGDVDLLSQEIRDGTDERFFDANDDGVVDNLDRTFWVHIINNTFFGDANLDDQFNSGDLVAVFQAGQYEDGSMAGWAAGDWNGDAEFNSGDLVVAFQDGGYETGPRAAANAVPEPTAAMLMLIGFLAVARRSGLQ